jgi:hypothetical protein
VDLASLLGGFLQRMRLLWLFPRLVIGAEGTAWVCTDDHVPIYVYPSSPSPLAHRHVDVDARLWNKGSQPVTAFEVTDAEAAGQILVPEKPNHFGAFEETTLPVEGGRVAQRFRLNPPDGEELRAGPGDEVCLKVRLSRGPARSLRLRLANGR